jgi:hypothetical protein
MKRRIWTIEFARAQRGWFCSITYTVTTGNQCTDETHTVREGCSGHNPFSIARAFWRAWQAYRNESTAQAKDAPAIRKAKGWAA